MKKIFVYLGAIILAAGVAGGIWFALNNSNKSEKLTADQLIKSTSEARTVEDLAKNAVQIDRSSTYIIGIDDALVPMSFKDANGKYIGFDIELMDEIAKAGNKKVIYKAIAFGDHKEYLVDKTIDAFIDIIIKDSRKDYADFSAPYIREDLVVAVRRSSDILSKDDLAGMVVGATRGSYMATLAKEFKDSKGNGFSKVVDSYKSGANVLVSLLEGNLNAAIVIDVEGKYFSENSPGKFRIIEGLFQTDDIGIAVRKGNVEVLEFLNKSLKKVQDSGAYDKIYSKWFGK